MTSVNDPPEQLELDTISNTDFQKLIDSDLCTVYELFEKLPGGSGDPEWCKSELREFLNPQRQTRDTGHVLAIYFLRQPISNSCELSLVSHVLRETTDYQEVCRSSAGTATWATNSETARFCLQTPKDDAEPSFSFGATLDRKKNSFQCLLVSPNSPEELLYSHDYLRREPRHGAACTAFVLLPLKVLQLHISCTSSALAELMRQVSKAEDQILDPAKLENFSILIRDLHSYNADLIKLERRWHFEQKLSSSVGEIIERFGSNVPDYIGNFFELLKRSSHASEYDLSVLPRRIQNQFTAVYNLMAQRDTKATISLATASQRDSSSIKTIAGMTLIFLPPTFICSFFSMSFFNFEATGAKSIWIYFATAAPLTAVVTLSWLVYTSWRRKADERRIEQKASSVHAV